MPREVYSIRKEYSDEELRELIVPFLYFGHEARATDIARVLGVSRETVYKILKRLEKEDGEKKSNT